MIITLLAIIIVLIPIAFVVFTIWFIFCDPPGETDPNKI